jgi:hypothetical protein
MSAAMSVGMSQALLAATWASLLAAIWGILVSSNIGCQVGSSSATLYGSLCHWEATLFTAITHKAATKCDPMKNLVLMPMKISNFLLDFVYLFNNTCTRTSPLESTSFSRL